MPEMAIPMALTSKSRLVSVIIPSYNHGQYVGEAIESVLRSTVQDFEIVVVDDGSVDNSVKVVEQFKDPRLRLIRQPNSGAHAAINRGVASACAPWIAILNSDDRYHPLKLQQHLELHEKNPNLEASASRIRHISESGVPFDPDGYINWRYAQLKNVSYQHPSLESSLLLTNHLITTSALFISRQSFKELGGFLPLRYVHDWFFYLALASRGRFHVLEQELVDYRIHETNTVRENDERSRIEDSFVLGWHFFEDPTGKSSAHEISRLFDFVKQNRMASLQLILLFQLWRTMNDSDLTKCAALFEDPEHPVMLLALQLSRKEHWGLNLKARMRKMFWPVLANHKFKGAKLLTKCLTLLRWIRKR